jgi:23S rRNA A1618 N6-methylase RlmF
MAAKRFGWSMSGTETNLSDFKIAEKNVENNDLTEKVRVIHNRDKTVIFPPEIVSGFSDSGLSGSRFSFSVCNPPFYEVTEIRREWKKFSEKNPGREHEMTVSGKSKKFSFYNESYFE